MRIDDVTEDFVQVFSKPENRKGPTAHFIGVAGLELLPEGVDHDDPRVIEIVRLCKAGE